MIWPPSNAISIRTRSGSATYNHLRENAVDGIRVDECHLEAEKARARPLVDQVRAGARKLSQRRVEIAHLVGHVVHPRPSLCEEAADGCVLAERLEQLDATVADANRRCTNSLSFDRRAVLDLRTEQPLVRSEGRVEVLDRNT
jgi:hypothetical protein